MTLHPCFEGAQHGAGEAQRPPGPAARNELGNEETAIRPVPGGEEEGFERQAAAGRAGDVLSDVRGEIGMKLFSFNRSDDADAKMSIITRFDIKDLSQSETYLRRWSLWLPFGWSLKLHCILRPDSDRCEHDHPWWFWRLVLSGGYWETTGVDQQAFRRPGSLSYCRHTSPTGSRSCPRGGPGHSLLCAAASRASGGSSRTTAGCTGGSSSMRPAISG